MSSDTHTPYVIIITGRPAAGKSTLAWRLAQELRLPLLSKDSIREVLFDQLGWKDRVWAKLLGRVSVDLMFHFADAQLAAGSPVILENTFDASSSTPRFEALCKRYDADTLQIVCDADSETLFNRFIERTKAGKRHPGHRDDLTLDELRIYLAEELSPVMELGGKIVEINTTDFGQIDYHGILEQVRVFEKMNQHPTG